MKVVPIHAAKSELSRLIKRACAGEEVIIALGKRPVVRLVPVDRPAPSRKFGALKGKLTVDESFFEPLSEEELAAWAAHRTGAV